jgi:Gas vesicle synthesis protein GvpL/GvpF
MPRSDDSLERLRAAIDELAAADAAELLSEARIEARARVRATLTDALAHSMLERLHDQLDVPTRGVLPASDPQPCSAPRHTSGTARASSPARAAKPAPATAPAPSPSLAKPSGERLWYVYGVVAADTELDGELPGVDPARPLTVLREGALAAVASQVPLEEFDEARLREHLADMVWVEATARAHEAVLDDIRRQATVIPMRMCTVYRTEGGIREMLRRESEALQDAIDHLDGKAEWGVKVFTDFARAGGRTANVKPGAGDATGAAYMERIRTERELRDRAIEVAEVAAAQIHDRLTAVVVDAQAIPLQRPEVSGHSGEMILNGVYLVAEDAAPAFHEQVEALRSEFEPHGIEIAPTGPWPAYNFVSGTIGAAW